MSAKSEKKEREERARIVREMEEFEDLYEEHLFGLEERRNGGDEEE